MHQKQPPAKVACAELVPLAGACCWAYVSHGAPKRASTARKPIIRWTLNLDMCSSLAPPHDPHALRETSDVYRSLYIRHLWSRGKAKIQGMLTKPEATIVSVSGSPV